MNFSLFIFDTLLTENEIFVGLNDLVVQNANG